jgi:hypothetical protein
VGQCLDAAENVAAYGKQAVKAGSGGLEAIDGGLRAIWMEGLPVWSQSPPIRCTLPKWAAWGLNFPAVVAQLGSSFPVPPRAFELYSIMPQASGNALPVLLRGMFLDDCALHATQDVDTAFDAASRAELG